MLGPTHRLYIVPEIDVATVKACQDPATELARAEVSSCFCCVLLLSGMNITKLPFPHQGSVGWMSSPLTRSERWLNTFCRQRRGRGEEGGAIAIALRNQTGTGVCKLALMSKRSGCKAEGRGGTGEFGADGAGDQGQQSQARTKKLTIVSLFYLKRSQTPDYASRGLWHPLLSLAMRLPAPKAMKKMDAALAREIALPNLWPLPRSSSHSIKARLLALFYISSSS
jgi:hypothetical protein